LSEPQIVEHRLRHSRDDFRNLVVGEPKRLWRPLIELL
jgi:hypothetical protein